MCTSVLYENETTYDLLSIKLNKICKCNVDENILKYE
jgi:hypothetical protein